MDAVLHNGAGAPTVRQRWVFTDQPFLPVGTRCVMLNRIWDADHISDLATGMLPIGFNNYKQDSRWKLPVDLKPGHMCNPQWLATGEPWPNDLPPQEYAPDGWPVCCERYLPVMAGVSVDTGADHGYPTAPTAGVSVDLGATPPGATVGASADYRPLVLPLLDVTAGVSVDLGASAPGATVGTSVDLGASAPGATVGTSVDLGAEPPGATVGASVDYIPGATNTSCADAAPFALDTAYDITVVVGGPHYWWVSEPMDPAFMEGQLLVDPPDLPNTGHWIVYEGDDCDSLTVIADSGLGHLNVLFSHLTAGRIWIEVYATDRDYHGTWEIFLTG